MTYFYIEVNQSLAKLLLNFNAGLAKLSLTPLGERAINQQRLDIDLTTKWDQSPPVDSSSAIFLA